MKVALSVLAFAILTEGAVYAAGLSAVLEKPKTPENQRDYTITFVALDIQNRPVVVRCYKKTPSEGGFSIFDSDKNLPSGGGSGTCSVTSSLVSAEGTYQYYVIASAEAETVQSATVSVDYKAGGPGTPTYYGKDHPSTCQYNIKFKTADDAGKTVKVEVYRSDQTSFNADSGTRIATVTIGSNQEGSHLDTVPECNKTYYYAVRAFNDAGNGSDAVGDTTSITIIQATPTTGAIPAGTGGSIASGTAVEEPKEELQLPNEESSEGIVLGEAAPSPTPTTPVFLSALKAAQWPIVAGILLILVGGGTILFRRKQPRE